MGPKNGFDVPRKQRLERLHGIRGRQVLEDVVQICIRLKAVGARAAHEGEQIRTGTCAERVVREELNTASLGKRSDLVLDRIVVYRHLAVLEMQHQLRPLAYRVRKRLAQCALGRGARQ